MKIRITQQQINLCIFLDATMALFDRLCERVSELSIGFNTETSYQKTVGQRACIWTLRQSLWKFPKDWQALETNCPVDAARANKYAKPNICQMHEAMGHTTTIAQLNNSDYI